MKKTKKYFSIAFLLFFTFTVSAQQSLLDLTQPEQQKDFLKYLRTTISLLQDPGVKEKYKGKDLENLSDSSKQRIADKMIKDTTYFKRLYEYFDFMKLLDSKYRISQFSSKDWKEVAQFGAKHGIYFISPIKKTVEPKNPLPSKSYYFPKLPSIDSVDKVHID